MSGWHEEYLARYKEAKERGRPFFPYAVFKDVVVSALVFVALSVLALKIGAKLEDLADPTDTAYNPRPEWYFLFLFQALKAFPGRYESVAAFALPVAGVIALLLLPFVDRSPRRHPLDRPLATGVGALALCGFAVLTVLGWRSPLINPVVVKDPQVEKGRRLYAQLNCAYCHSIRGKGGRVGPPLDEAAQAHTADWLKRHFRDPRAVVPGSVMPKLNLLPDEVDALTAYVESLGAGAYTKEAPKLFAENCQMCHDVHGKGGEVGPDLSEIGAAREKAFLKAYIEDPTKVKPDTVMPSFKGQLTDVQIEDLARYLASLKQRGSP